MVSATITYSQANMLRPKLIGPKSFPMILKLEKETV